MKYEKNGSFKTDKLLNLRLPMNVVRQLTELGEKKGKQDLYKEQAPEILETLRQVAFIQSAESSNRIENVLVEPERLRDLIEKKTTPKNRSENEVAGYRDVLETIHSSWKYLDIKPEVIQQMHRDLYKYTPMKGGRWKQSDNYIIERYPDGTTRVRFHTVHAWRVQEEMDVLCSRFQELRDSGNVDGLILTAAFILDFLCIHPFPDGNGRIARLLMLLLLYQFGYEVGRYISLERVIEESKETYYESLYESSQGWYEGEHDLLPWLTYFLGVLQRAYKEFEEGVNRIEKSPGVKSTLVRNVVEHMRGPFTFNDLLQKCPLVSPHTVRKVLQKLKEEGVVEPIGRGRNAKYIRKYGLNPHDHARGSNRD